MKLVLYFLTPIPLIMPQEFIVTFDEMNLQSAINSVSLNLYKINYRISRPIRRTAIFSLEILEKNNDDCILILVIYWKKTGLLHTKISNHNIIYSSQKPRKSSSLPLKSSSWLFSLDAGTGIYKFGNNTYPRCIKRRSNLGHIFREKKCILWAGKYGTLQQNQIQKLI